MDMDSVSRDTLHSAGIEQLVVGSGLILFWGWLLARWVNDWLLAPLGVGPGAGEHIIAPSAIASVGSTLSGASGPASALVSPLGGALTGMATAIEIAPSIATAVVFTIALTVAGMLLGLVLAVPLAVLRVYGGPFRWLALAYTELIRGTPLLAQLFVWYYGLPLAVWLQGVGPIGGALPEQAFWIAIFGFTINSSAYQAEYIRGALESVDTGQLTAARAIGLSKLEGIRHVVLPQTLRYAVPAWTNEFVYLAKYSSLAAFLNVPEVYYQAEQIASQTFAYTPIFGFVGLVYLGLVLSITDGMRRVERAIAIPGLGSLEGREQGNTE